MNLFTLCFADEVEFIFQDANRLYEAGEYESAIQEYEKVLNTGYQNGELFFNLGNSYYKAGYIGKAILNYERAKKWMPNDDDIDFNLKLTNLRVVVRIEELPNPFAFIYRWSGIIPISLLTWLILITFYAVCGIWIFRFIQGSHRFVRRIQILNIVLVLFLIIIVILFVLQAYETGNRIEGVITYQYPVEVRSSPAADGTELFVIHEGVKFRLEEEINEWAEIRLADGKTGWVKKETFETI